MAILGPQGIRDAIRKSYFKHLDIARKGSSPEGTSEHQLAMYGALGTRYMAGSMIGESACPDEISIWCELAPFFGLDPNSALDALAEYIVYKEEPAQSEVEFLRGAIQSGLKNIANTDWAELANAGKAKRFAWTYFVEDDDFEQVGG